MGAGSQLTVPGGGKAGGVYTWEEVQQHSSRTDQWLVIDRKVYNITQWAKRHPGGLRVIGHYAGEDATEAFAAFHPDPTFVQKFLKPLLIGELEASEPSQDRNKNAALIQDFHALRAQAKSDGLFQARPLFFCLHLGHIVLLEALAWLMIWYWGTNWIVTLLCGVILATAQSQAGWLQHDFGHLSVFKESRWNHLVHKFIIGHLKYGIKKIKLLPYHRQHQYFFLVGPPLLIPVFFHIQIIRTMIIRHDWVDLAWCVSYYFRYFFLYIPLYGLFGSIALLSFVRFLESHWFVWVTQMNHLPMDIDHEKHRDWLTMQLQATCNIEQSFFNDWFSGHLNFQIEHHLFPTMPRHNYHLVAPRVRALCETYGVPYQMKTMWQGFTDIVWYVQYR
uniref:acyl-CoA (8-3)-desaturase n=1 Tax=Echeneis naucrates TaxID=173247 RepID=A0A665UCJ7_ECHNA